MIATLAGYMYSNPTKFGVVHVMLPSMSVGGGPVAVVVVDVLVVEVVVLVDVVEVLDVEVVEEVDVVVDVEDDDVVVEPDVNIGGRRPSANPPGVPGENM